MNQDGSSRRETKEPARRRRRFVFWVVGIGIVLVALLSGTAFIAVRTVLAWNGLIRFYTSQFEPSFSHLLGETGFCARRLSAECVRAVHDWMEGDVALLSTDDATSILPRIQMTELAGYRDKRGNRYVVQRFYETHVAVLKLLSTDGPYVYTNHDLEIRDIPVDHREIEELSSTVALFGGAGVSLFGKKARGTSYAAVWSFNGRYYAVKLDISIIECAKKEQPCLAAQSFVELISRIRYSGKLIQAAEHS